MSSELKASERKQVLMKTKPEDCGTTYKRSKFVRSSSLESIRKFNTFICSQNYYYILPAIFSWLKTSHKIIQSNLKKFIVSIKMYIFSLFIYKMVDGCVRCGYRRIKEDIKKGINAVYCQVRENSFAAVVYLTMAAIFSQLMACVYMLSSTLLPGGLIFMVTCLYLITHINHSCLRYFLKQWEEDKIVTSDKVKFVGGRASRRDILGKRSLSSFKVI